MPETASQPVLRRRPVLALAGARTLAFLAVLGPGFITANVDNDPGGISTYSQAGAQFGYQLLWSLIPITIALIIVQEMAARMGAITGKGLSDLIREEFGLRATFFTMLVLGMADFGNIVSEFAGLASGSAIFGISKYIAVPLGATLVWVVIVRGRYKPVERVLLVASLLYFAYPVSAFLAKPDWNLALKQTLIPTFSDNHDYLILLVGLIGTTITPWMQFYLQAAVVEKGVDVRTYSLCRLDVITGCIVTDVVAFFIVVACGATIYHSKNHDITDAGQFAIALVPFAGKFAGMLFAVALINAALLSAAILPLATSYNICEGLGFESGVDKRFSEAPVFYWLYTLLIGGGALVVLIPNFPLLKMMIYSQVINGVLLPFVIIYMLLLINRPRLMGEYKNKPWQNAIAWVTAVTVIILSCIYMASQISDLMAGKAG
jgi:Mn2+/Fe2+ NRAMP family transporter